MRQINPVLDKLYALRYEMRRLGIDAYIIRSADPHLGEYFADYWKSREWISGFDGSAGTVVVTLDKAGLWTDSRYFVQAEKQLQGSSIVLHKLNASRQARHIEWTIEQLGEGGKVGYDAAMFSMCGNSNLHKKLTKANLSPIDVGDLFNEIWTNRPAIPLSPLFIHELPFAGKTVTDKLTEIRAKMEEQGASHYLITALDDLAWAFNIRGKDVDFNPLVLGYALVGQTTATLFIDERKVGAEAKASFEGMGIELTAYENVNQVLSKLNPEATIWLDPKRTNAQLASAVPETCTIFEKLSIVTSLKGIKNEVEMNRSRATMARDGVALVHFFRWLEANLGQEDTTITEVTIGEKLIEFRSQQDHYIGESFPTIAGYKGNGAIVHYRAKAKTAKTIQPEGILLIDSGAQYLDGTTDITRTIALGTPTKEEKRDYTLVLKGNIQLSMAKFPKGTTGKQLDTLARNALWQQGMNYMHGTGHGVGYCLNVHEGPQNIGPGLRADGVSFEPGMITSNEPGLYHKGKYGIRIENLILCIEAETNGFGTFYEFDTITLCPIDTQLIAVELLTNAERNWFNTYHQKVYDQLSPALNEAEKAWLAGKTKSI